MKKSKEEQMGTQEIEKTEVLEETAMNSENTQKNPEDVDWECKPKLENENSVVQILPAGWARMIWFLQVVFQNQTSCECLCVCAALSLGEMFSLERMLEPLSATVSPSLPLKKERFACRAENLKRYKCEHVSKSFTRWGLSWII